MRRVVVIGGPTASGKTATSLALAEATACEIISADARQIYCGMDIGTAKPTLDERRRVPHHLLDIRQPGEAYNAAQYAQDVHSAIENIPRSSLPVIVGGSGLYIKAALDGLSSPIGEIDESIREALVVELEERGRDALYDELQRVDPVAAELYVDRNPRRITRALEVYRATGKPLSSFWNAAPTVSKYDVMYFATNHERSVLRSRIDLRCDWMWENGLLEETQRLLDADVDPECQALQTVGYREAISVLQGTSSLEHAQAQLKISTWHYAKRQLTWFMRDSRYQWLSNGPELNAAAILDMISERKRIEA
ncbi:MAG: tRNA (adenosine(37)-N6)-dimethylallyltransferase MiaA [Candidatus Kapabacteria bacterium]|nr:tRNA (adenosine(37)-N6)-dimethylallyltransferase MiaA [Candidatus Kapabacteria bacterium]